MPGIAPGPRRRVLSNEIDAQPSDNGAGVVFVQIVKGEAVVEQSRRLLEHLTSHLEVHLGAFLGYCLCGCQELIERWVYGAGWHSARACHGAHVPASEYGARCRPDPMPWWPSVTRIRC